jgi:hypothetical protein
MVIANGDCGHISGHSQREHGCVSDRIDIRHGGSDPDVASMALRTVLHRSFSKTGYAAD